MLELIKRYLSREKAPDILRWPFTYSLGQAMIRGRLLRFPYRAAAMMVEYGLEETKKVYNRRLPSVWASAFFPTELLHALGIPSSLGGGCGAGSFFWLSGAFSQGSGEQVVGKG